MLVCLGAADSVPEGQRVVRIPPARRIRALPSSTAPGAAHRSTEPEPEPERLYEPAYVHNRQADNLPIQRACEAYRASELIQPRPGLFLRVKA